MEQNGLSHRTVHPPVGRCLTAITVTGSAKDGNALPLETFDDFAHALPGVFRGMFGYPQRVVKSSLKWIRITSSSNTLSKLKRVTYSAESIRCDGITFEELWCIYLEAVTSKIVGEELDGDSLVWTGEGEGE